MAKAMQKLMSKGNEKLDKTILGWSITPIKSCLNCSQCKGTCYAVKPYNRYPAVKLAWDRNFELAKSGEFMKNIIDQLERVNGAVVVRIHVSGDFFSQDYIDAWETIAKIFPDVKFYTYTKVMHMFDFSSITSLDNVNIINSIAEDGKPNFGDNDRVNELVSMGYRVCPATVKGNDIICGGNHKNSCTLCQTYNKVCFHKH